MTLDEQRQRLLADIERDRRTARRTTLPVLVGLGSLAVLVVAAALVGLISAGALARGGGPADAWVRAAVLVLGGGSGGLVLTAARVIDQLAERNREFLRGERQFTAYTARARAADTVAKYTELVADYGSRT